MERWVFSKDDLIDPQNCSRYDRFLYDSSRPIVVYRNGKVSGMYVDGEDISCDLAVDDAKIADVLYTYDWKTANIWRDVIVDRWGSFVDFAPTWCPVCGEMVQVVNGDLEVVGSCGDTFVCDRHRG